MPIIWNIHLCLTRHSHQLLLDLPLHALWVDFQMCLKKTKKLTLSKLTKTLFSKYIWSILFLDIFCSYLRHFPPIELGSEGMTTCSGWFSSSLKFCSSTFTAIGDSVVRFEGPGLGELQLLGRKGKAGDMVAVTGLGVWLLFNFLVLVNTGLPVLVVLTAAFLISVVSTLKLSGLVLLNSETDWWSHKPWTLRDSADRRNDCKRPRSTCTYKKDIWIMYRLCYN